MVERVEVKDVRVPEQLQRAMAAEAEAARNARAKVIAAEGEHKASRSLRLAAEVITDSPAALQVGFSMSDIRKIRNKLLHIGNITLKSHLCFCSFSLIFQLRYLQTLNGISAENNSTIIFPVPIDIMSSFMQSASNNQQQQQFQQQMFQQMCQGFSQPSFQPPFQPPHPSTLSQTQDIKNNYDKVIR